MKSFEEKNKISYVNRIVSSSPLKPGLVSPDKDLSVGQIEQFNI